MLVALLHFWQGCQGLHRRWIKISNFGKSLLFFASIYIHNGDDSPAGSNLPASIFIWIIAMLLVEKLETGNVQLDVYNIAMFALPIFAITVKLSAATPIGIAILIMVQQIWSRQFMNATALGVMFWLLTVSNVRFGYDFLVSSISLLASPAAILPLQTLREPRAVWVIGSLFLLSIVFQEYFLFGASEPGELLQHAVMPTDYLPSRASLCPVKNAMRYCHRVANQCSFNLFPCIANSQLNVEMRGTTLQDGFQTVPLP